MKGKIYRKAEIINLYSTETFPLDDIEPNGLKISSVPHEKRMQGSSFWNPSNTAEMPKLPDFKDCPQDELEELFIRKVKLCRIVFDFNDALTNIYNKETKRRTLVELKDFINHSPIDIHTRPMYRALFKMSFGCYMPFDHYIDSSPSYESFVGFILHIFKISINIFRALPLTPEFDLATEEQEPYYENSWPHLVAIDLLDTKDDRERQMLFNIIYVIYIKIYEHRLFIRRIIQGLNVPIKDEHIQFLNRSLLPLHADELMHNYHKSLKKCVMYYIEKDNELATTVYRFHKPDYYILIMDEMEMIFRIIPTAQISELLDPVLKFLCKMMKDEHFQVKLIDVRASKEPYTYPNFCSLHFAKSLGIGSSKPINKHCL
ncbi:hypothetical protein RF11_07063 [Thelohanellus kitauei]|uniref:Uncharacterized protein n=1 Tax=Thelohanellus kitauei TaxID=669202 RepID=A0A0C2M556_THEKT|nr:hypothetical protein RF11_07063 [Thelohanellus kitauei]